MATKALTIKRYLDAANLEDIQALSVYPWLSGVTTNPSLVAKAGIQNYRAFAQQVLTSFPQLDISFEVLADDASSMIDQARVINQWGNKAWVKIPIVNSTGKSMAPVIETLSKDGIALNITAIYLADQVEVALKAIAPGSRAILSVFSGRIADTGVDPIPILRQIRTMVPVDGLIELLWASTREAFNIVQANELGCDIITAPKPLLVQAMSFGKCLEQCSIDTVKAFLSDTKKSGLNI